MTRTVNTIRSRFQIRYETGLATVAVKVITHNGIAHWMCISGPKGTRVYKGDDLPTGRAHLRGLAGCCCNAYSRI